MAAKEEEEENEEEEEEEEEGQLLASVDGLEKQTRGRHSPLRSLNPIEELLNSATELTSFTLVRHVLVASPLRFVLVGC